MGKSKLILLLALLAVLVLAGVAGWRIAACALADFELRQAMRDLAAQVPSRIGLTPQSTDEDFRIAVVRSAQEHEIQLEPAQVTVRRTGTHEAPIIYLAADYTVPATLLGFSFTLHFAPSSAK
jgi:ABC-type sugar transport system substrate-binding protein